MLAGELCLCGRPRKIVKKITNAFPLFLITIGNVLSWSTVIASESTVKQIISIIEASSKVYEPKTYDEMVNNIIYDR